MKILFVMRHSAYMRNYEGVLRQLAAEGHRIHMAVELNRERMGADRLGRALSEEMRTLSVAVVQRIVVILLERGGKKVGARWRPHRLIGARALRMLTR